MSKLVFINNDKKVIRALLKDIGQERCQCALKDAGLDKMPPISMEGFYVEFDVKTCDFSLYHRYPSRVVMYIMSILGFWALPVFGWEMKRVDVEQGRR